MNGLKRIKVELWNNTKFYLLTNLDERGFKKILSDWIFENRTENFSCRYLIEFISKLNMPGVEAVAYGDIYTSIQKSDSYFREDPDLSYPDLEIVF
jgi:hypothetical protein